MTLEQIEKKIAEHVKDEEAVAEIMKMIKEYGQSEYGMGLEDGMVEDGECW